MLSRNPEYVRQKLRDKVQGPNTVEELRQCDIDYGWRVATAYNKYLKHDLCL